MAYFQPPYDYTISLGSEEPFDPKDSSIGDHAQQKVAEGKQKLADALNIPVNELPDFGGELYIVQLQAAPNDKDIENLQSMHGLSFGHPLSDISYLEKLSGSSVSQLEAAQNEKYSGIRAVIGYWPELKVDIKNITGEELKIGLYNADYIQIVKNVLFELGANPDSIRTDTSGEDTTVIAKFNTPISIDLISCISEVAWVEEITEDVPENLNVSGVAQSGNPANEDTNDDGDDIRTADEVTHPIWEKGIHGEDQIIGIIDRGDLDLNNPFLVHSTNESMDSGESHRKIIKILPRPDNSSNSTHAMNVIGCAIADHIDEPGEHQHRGGAWAARIGYADSRAIDLSKFLETCKDHNAFIITRSLTRRVSDGSRTPHVPGTRVAYGSNARDIDEFLFHNEDYIHLNSSPNAGSTFGTCGTVAKNSVVVGGVQAPPNHNSRRDDLISSQDEGQRSNTADNRIKPDVLAVAEGITTIDLNNEIVDRPINGNSYATPHVAAAAALVRQYYMEGWHNNGFRDPDNGVTPSGSLIKATLLNATVPTQGQDRDSYPFEGDGWGRLQLNRTLDFDDNDVTIRTIDVRNNVGIGLSTSSIEHDLPVNDNIEVLKITLVFNDVPPFFSNSNNPSINHVFLEVLGPVDYLLQREKYYCNDFDGLVSRSHGKITYLPPLRPSISHPIENELKNNVRQVVIHEPQRGNWKIIVHHKILARHRLRYAKQGYSIVITQLNN